MKARMKKLLFSIQSIFAYALFFVAYSAVLVSVSATAQVNEDAPITFRAFARSYSPNNCSYYSNIDAEVVLQTTQKKMIGSLVATAEVHASYARNQPNSWYSIDEALEFKAYLTHERNYLYTVSRNFTLNSRGSFNYDKMRFKVERNDDGKVSALPSIDPRNFYVIDISGLNPSCDRHDDNFVEVPVQVKCMDIEGLEPCETGAL